MNISKQEIEQIVSQVLSQGMGQADQAVTQVTPSPAPQSSYGVASGQGIFDKMEDAINAAHATYKEMANYSLKDRQRFVDGIKSFALNEKSHLAGMIVEETMLGNYDDKLEKIELAAMTPGTEILKTYAQSGDTGLAVIEQSPYGVIGATTPVTNPAETVISNAIAMIAAGNTVVFNAHPSSKGVCAYTVRRINEEIMALGGPQNMITMVKEPSMASLEALASSPKINILVGTGGPGLVKALLQSGKKAIGAGAGNPPVVVDETADIQKAAADIIKGHSFDNNIVCILEKEVFVVEEVANELIASMEKEKAFLLTGDKIKALEALVVSDGHTKKEWVGKDAYKYLDAIGVQYTDQPKCIICEVDFNHPFVQLELLMPILPIVRVNNFEQGVAYAVEAEHGNRHTAVVHSQNVKNITYYAKAIGTTIFVKNAPSLAGIGVNSESVISFTIAGPTGEGITTAKDFTRTRHCVIVDGFRII